MSATNSPVPSSTVQHVPAWKKLGLKLKYAKDTADAPTSRPEPSQSLKGNKRTAAAENEEVVSKPSKKHKASKAGSHEGKSSSSEDFLASVPTASIETATTVTPSSKTKHHKFESEE